MADAIIANVIPTTYGQALSLFVEMLVSAGWSYKASGDGLSGYSSTGKIFTGTGTGALGWSNARAWARVQDPGARREIVVQHNNAGPIRVKYSPLAKFTGGSPSATVTPSATDEKYLPGGATDATPTYASLFFPSNLLTSNIKCQGFASGTAPYSFWYTGFVTPAGATQFGLMMDGVNSVPEDPDPVIWHWGTTDAYTNGALGQPFGTGMLVGHFVANGGSNHGSWGFMDLALTSFAYLMPGATAYGTPTVGSITAGVMHGVNSGGSAVNVFNAKHDADPVRWGRPPLAATLVGAKGYSKSARWTTIARTTGLDTLNNKLWVCHGALWLPWDGATTPTN